MKTCTSIVFEEMPTGWIPTGTYAIGQGGKLPRPERIQVGNIACLRSQNVTVLVTVDEINGDNLCGRIRSFENYEKPSLSGCEIGDRVEFSIRNVEGWMEG
jgi:hypothetical protein